MCWFMAGYLEELIVRLATGIELLPVERRALWGQFFRKRQQSNGGFAGRDGACDAYYTGFGLRTLAMLGELDRPVASSAATFLQEQLASRAARHSIVDFLSIVYSARLLDFFMEIDIFADTSRDWKQHILEVLFALRRDDGGFAKGPSGNASSTYHTFLVIICLELLGAQIPDPQQVVAFLHTQRGDDGGFREIRVSKRSGTNPTAAAIATLRSLDALTDDLAEGAVEFLWSMQNEEGGFRANTRIPIADLLSTFTSLTALRDLDALDQVDLTAAAAFATSLEQPDGGFVAAAWDAECDVEYSFYGVGTRALCVAPGDSREMR